MLLHDIIAFSARKHPDKPALFYEDTVVTFAELLSRLRRVANGLLSVATPGDRVAVLSENRAEYIDLYYGVPAAKMGLTFLNYRLNPKELTKIVNDAGARMLVTEGKYLDTVTSIVADMPTVEAVLVMGGGVGTFVDYDDFLAAAPDAVPDVEVAEDDLAWLIYTSGTTGMPKGAMLSHRNLLMSTLNAAVGVTAGTDEVTLFPWPLCRRRLRVPDLPPAGLASRADAGLRDGELLRPHRALPRHQRVDGADDDEHAARPPEDRAVRPEQHPRMGYGAAPMPVEVLRRSMEKFPGAGFGTGFGMTELSGNVFSLPDEAHQAALAGDIVGAAVGRPADAAVVRAHRRRRHERRRRGRGRRARRAGRPGDDGLLGQPGGHRRGVRRRLVPQRRPGQVGRGAATSTSSTARRT